jgi:hypothetical protein
MEEITKDNLLTVCTVDYFRAYINKHLNEPQKTADLMWYLYDFTNSERQNKELWRRLREVCLNRGLYGYYARIKEYM